MGNSGMGGGGIPPLPTPSGSSSPYGQIARDVVTSVHDVGGNQAVYVLIGLCGLIALIWILRNAIDKAVDAWLRANESASKANEKRAELDETSRQFTLAALNAMPEQARSNRVVDVMGDATMTRSARKTYLKHEINAIRMACVKWGVSGQDMDVHLDAMEAIIDDPGSYITHESRT